MAKIRRNYEDEEELDEEYEDDDEEEYGGPFSNPFVKFGLIGGIIAVIILGVVFVRMSNSKPVEEKPKTEQVEKKEEKEEKKQVEVPKNEPEKVEPKGIDEKSATASLERSDAPLSAEESAKIGETLQTALTKLKESGTRAQNDVKLGLSLTKSGMFNAVHGLIGNGFALDIASVKGYKSDHSNVQQFTFNLTKEGAKPITLTGNYVPDINQLGLVQIHGELPGLGSPTEGPQVDPNIKNPDDNPKKEEPKKNS